MTSGSMRVSSSSRRGATASRSTIIAVTVAWRCPSLTAAMVALLPAADSAASLRWYGAAVLSPVADRLKRPRPSPGTALLSSRSCPAPDSNQARRRALSLLVADPTHAGELVAAQRRFD